MKWVNRVGVFIVTMGVSSVAWSGIADFYVADGQGQIYSVNGKTLAASEVFTVQGGLAINDIIFVGDNKMLANVTDQLIQYDMTTGVETVIFDVRDIYGEDGFYFTSGFAGTENNDIFFSIQAFTDDGSELYGATYNPITDSFHELATLQESVGGLYFDFLEVGENLFLGADFENEQIRLLNSFTGEDVASYDAGFGPVSFLEIDDQIFSLSDSGGLYTFYLETGESEFYGDISGVSGAFLGATSTDIFRIPAPGSLPLIGFAGMVALRRRR